MPRSQKQLFDLCVCACVGQFDRAHDANSLVHARAHSTHKIRKDCRCSHHGSISSLVVSSGLAFVSSWAHPFHTSPPTTGTLTPMPAVLLTQQIGLSAISSPS